MLESQGPWTAFTALGERHLPGWLSELDELHLPGMRAEVKRSLILLMKGVSRSDIANREGVGTATVKRWIEIATAEIASHLPEEHASPGELRGGWVVGHVQCCLKDQLEACA